MVPAMRGRHRQLWGVPYRLRGSMARVARSSRIAPYARGAAGHGLVGVAVGPLVCPPASRRFGGRGRLGALGKESR